MKAEIKEKCHEFDKSLAEFYTSKRNKYPALLYDAMEYSLFSGGKRIRPFLMMLSAEFFNVSFEKVKELAFALEFIHTYSLIHDDLPAMDDDDFRRGKPTCHKKYGEALAILAGDAFLNLAYETMFSAAANNSELIKSAAFIAKCAGGEGMVAGQVIDIYCKNLSEESMLDMYNKKTGGLIKAAVLTPFFLSSEKALYGDIYKFSEYLGFIFQLSDDILDTGKIEENSYLNSFGIEMAKEKINFYNNCLHNTLDKYGERADKLIKFSDFITTRDN